jgi:hypothetical protein
MAARRAIDALQSQLADVTGAERASRCASACHFGQDRFGS